MLLPSVPLSPVSFPMISLPVPHRLLSPQLGWSPYAINSSISLSEKIITKEMKLPASYTVRAATYVSRPLIPIYEYYADWNSM